MEPKPDPIEPIVLLMIPAWHHFRRLTAYVASRATLVTPVCGLSTGLIETKDIGLMASPMQLINFLPEAVILPKLNPSEKTYIHSTV